ncbi:MarR family transcriptional regulator [Kineococcus sp. LSe6-4]|uniref:MarR family transcriptional regulator n=1 Tax=Kineococcus halophytocola TaxID=3234027 RepID=A0ABV4H1J2_9ACTN
MGDDHRERDSVDDIVDQWAVQRPDLDVRPVGVITRLARVRAHLDAELTAVFDRYDLSPADFQVIVTLRRSGAPFRLAQAKLMTALGLTSGTISVRVDRLVRRGVVRREPDETDARVTLVRLTDEGERLFDDIAPVHLANEDRLLSALDDDERGTLAALLRRLLVSFESPVAGDPGPWGFVVEPAHRARARRIAVGLSDTPGLLVADVTPGGPAARAGIARGDLVVAVDGRPARCAAALDPGAAELRLEVLRGEEPVTVRLRGERTAGR